MARVRFLVAAAAVPVVLIAAVIGAGAVSPAFNGWLTETLYQVAADPVPTDASVLEGTWLLHLPRGPWPGLTLDDGDPVVGRLTLERERGQDRWCAGATTCGTLVGTFRVTDPGWLSRPPRGDSAIAFLSETGEFFMHLGIVGDCGDCGPLALRGWLGNDSDGLTGFWVQGSLGEGPSGPATFRRVAFDDDAPAT